MKSNIIFKKVISLFAAVSALLIMSIGVSAADDVTIDETNFPDAVFRQYVSDNVDANRNGILSRAELANITQLEVYSKNIKSLTGIEHFTNLTFLFCYDNELTTLDVSKNTALFALYCYDNNLTSLNFSGCKTLRILSCANNQLTSLNVSKNTSLAQLYCNNNKLKNIDVGSNSELLVLNCGGNPLSSVDVSKNTALESLICAENGLASLDLSKNTALEYLNCSGNTSLGSLDVSNNAALEHLNCSNSGFTSLSLKNNTKLELLNCSNNRLTVLDMSKNPELIDLNCNNNRLVSMDLSECTALKNLQCDNNLLTELDLTGYILLKNLQCDNNNLKILGLRSCVALENLQCSNNKQIESLDLSKCIALKNVQCDNNMITALDLSNCAMVKNVLCNNNKIALLDLSNCTSLENVRFNNNQVTSLVLPPKIELAGFVADNNKYDIYVDDNCCFDLATLPGSFDVSKASNWVGCTISENILTADSNNGVVTYTYDCGNRKSVNFVLGINKMPLQITEQPTDYIGVVGKTATFEVTAKGATSYQWQQNTGNGWVSINTNAARKPSFDVVISEARGKFQYRCVVSDGTKSIESNPVKMIIKEAVTITTQPENYIGELNERAVFSVTAKGENLTYQWQQNTGTSWTNINTKAGRNPSFSVEIITKRTKFRYRCVVSDGMTSATSDEVRMEIKKELAILKEPTDYKGELGEKATFKINATGNNLTYQWQQNTGNGWTDINTAAGKSPSFSVDITAARCKYQYQCIVSDGTKTITSKAVKMVVDQTFKIITQPENYTGKIGEIATFLVETEGENLTYQWQQNTGSSWTSINTAAGRSTFFSVAITEQRLGYQYRCIVSNGISEVETNAVKMIEFAIKTQPENYSGEIGDVAKFKVEAAGENLTYQWQQDTGLGWTSINTTAGRSTTLSVGVAEFRIGYKYRCVVSNGTDFVISDAVEMIVNGGNFVITTQPTNYTGAVGDTAKFTVEATGATTYQWYQNTGNGWAAINTSAGRSKTLSVEIASFRTGYKYRCVVSDGTTSLTSDEVQMTIS